MYFVGIYARLSVDGGERKNESIETQIEIAKEYMKRQGDMVLYGCYTDLGRTGANFERRGFERMMEDVRFRKVDCIIVKDFSRFGRNYIETGNYLQKIFPFLGVRFISVTEGYDSLLSRNDDIGINLKNLANEMYTKDIAVKVRSSKRSKWESGSYTGGIPPYGYRAEWSGGRKRLLVETETAEIVREMFRFYCGGKNLREIAEWLYGERLHRPAEYRRYGHPRRQDGEILREWSRMSIKAVLTNPVYMGCMVQTASGGGDYMLRKPGDIDSGEWLVKAGTHEAVVSEELFFKAARRFGKRRVQGADVRAFGEKLLEEDIFEGVLFCGKCGKKLGRNVITGKARWGQESHGFHYFCRNAARIDELHCAGSRISGEILSRLVKAALGLELALSDLKPEKLARENARCAEGQMAVMAKECRTIQKRIKQKEQACSEQYIRYREGFLSREEFLEHKFRNRQEACGLKRELDILDRRIRVAEEEAARQRILLQKLPELDENWTPDREMIAALVKEIRLYPDKRVELVFRCGAALGRDVPQMPETEDPGAGR